MKKVIVFIVLIGIVISSAYSQQAQTQSVKYQTFKAGGRTINLPNPIDQMTEVGYENRELMEIVIPSTNRLIAAFVLDNELPKLLEGDDDFVLSEYAMIQVPRRGEYYDCGASDFKEVIRGAEKEFGKVVSSSLEEAEDEFNRRMKSLDLEEYSMDIGKPIQLGCLFSKKDAYGFGMIMPVTGAGVTVKMVAACIMARVNNRLLFIYVYKEYQNEESVQWIRSTSEKWIDSILLANN